VFVGRAVGGRRLSPSPLDLGLSTLERDLVPVMDGEGATANWAQERVASSKVGISIHIPSQQGPGARGIFKGRY
jgi:hypothetical protein